MKRLYKINTNIVQTVRILKRFVVFLDTGSVSTFIWASEINDNKDQETKRNANFRKASDKSFSIYGIIAVVVQICTSKKIVNYLLVEKLSISAILGSNLCNFHVEALKEMLAIIQMDESSTVPIIRQPANANITLPFPEEQDLNTRKESAS